MAGIGSNTTDLWFSGSGDLKIDLDRHDLKVATNNNRRVLRQSLLKILQSTAGDWPMQKSLGASLSTFAGMPNTRDTASLIEAQLKTALTRESMVDTRKLDVTILPLSNTELLILLEVSVPFTRQAPILIQFSYDLRDNKLIPRIV